MKSGFPFLYGIFICLPAGTARAAIGLLYNFFTLVWIFFGGNRYFDATFCTLWQGVIAICCVSVLKTTKKYLRYSSAPIVPGGFQ